MQTVSIHDKHFSLFISEAQINQRCEEIASEINEKYQGKTPVFICVLNGAFQFFANVVKRIKLPCEVHFVKYKSYVGTQSSGAVQELLGVPPEIEGREIILLEDIVDTGTTLQHLMAVLQPMQPKSVEVCTLLMKPECYKGAFEIHYCAFSVDDAFVVGYGLDYNDLGRNLPAVYTLQEHKN